MPSLNPGPPCRIVHGLQELASDYDVLLCDVWGVVHDGKRAFRAATDALTRFRETGGTVVLLTNAPRPNDSVVAQLDELGVPRSVYDEIVTSGDATVALIEARGDRPLHHIGPPRDLALFEEVRRKTGRAPRLTGLREASCVICTGLFDDGSETPDDYTDVYAAMRARDLDMICANPDVVVHVGERLIFCGGALAERYEALGGAVLYAGKPHPPIYQVALRAAAARRGQEVDEARVLAVGDGLRTDIAGARGQELKSLFVTSGIHRDETLIAGTGQLARGARDAVLRLSDQRPAAAISQLSW